MKTTVPRRRLFFYLKIPTYWWVLIKSIGGAAGNRTPVRKVTNYLSTSLVQLNYLRLLRLKAKRKMPYLSRNMMSHFNVAPH